MTDYTHGTWVEWDWGQGTGTGQVSEKFTEKVTRRIKGTEVTRDADAETPAYLIEQEDGGEVLKSASELRKASG